LIKVSAYDDRVLALETTADLINMGKSNLAVDLAAHIGAGAGDESSVAANTDALDRVKLVASVATGVGNPSTATSVLGLDLRLPILTAPMGPMELVHPGGALAVASGAAQAGAATTVALTSSPVLEQAVGPNQAALFQLYWWGDRDWVRSIVDRAGTAGYRAIVLTVDAPDYGTRRVDIRNGFDHHGQMTLPNLIDAPPTRDERMTFQRAVTFTDIAWLVDVSPLPVVLKGVLAGADARRAIDAGVAGVYVSNHGGRALAGQIGTMDALDEVASEIGSEGAIVVDGGFSTGEDIAKALALGADLIGMGRPIAYALAVDGANGVERFLQLVQAELVTALTVLGAPSPEHLSQPHIRLVN